MRSDDEADFSAAHEEMALEGFTFGLGYDPSAPFADYIEGLDQLSRGLRLPGRWENWVPSTLLVADVGGVIVGRSSIRFELNDFLAHEGGHIG